MAIEFENPVVAGTTLVREAIQSQNYQPGAAGWQVAADGTAEFADLTIRSSDGSGSTITEENGVITITDGSGRLVSRISAAGYELYAPDTGTLLAAVVPAGDSTHPAGFKALSRFGTGDFVFLGDDEITWGNDTESFQTNPSISVSTGGATDPISMFLTPGRAEGSAVTPTLRLDSAPAPATSTTVTLDANGGPANLALSGHISAGTTDWTSWTPVVAGGGSATFGTRDGWYSQLGELVYAEGYFTVGTAGSGSTPVTMSLPFEPYRGSANRRQLLPGGGPAGPVAGLVFAGGTGAQLDRLTDGTGATVTGASLTAGSVWTFNGWYRRVAP